MTEVHTIIPYRQRGQWMFDDESRDIEQEPFVAGADIIIDVLLRESDIHRKRAKTGFRLTFSDRPYPEATTVATLIGPSLEKFAWWSTLGVPLGLRGTYISGHDYRVQLGDEEMEGWLCPALLAYFDEAPQEIYFHAEEIRRN